MNGSNSTLGIQKVRTESTVLTSSTLTWLRLLGRYVALRSSAPKGTRASTSFLSPLRRTTLVSQKIWSKSSRGKSEERQTKKVRRFS